MEIFNFSIARVAFNGNTQPYIVRSDKEAEECNDFIKSDGCEIVEIKHENKEEFKYICNRLGMDNDKVNVKRVWKACGNNNKSPMYFCLYTDWDYKK